jgi:DNA-binding NarL/FixJ family response regulator
MMRLGLRTFLTQRGVMCICGEASDAAAALAGIERAEPDLVLLDISLRGRSGLDLLTDLRSRFPRLPVLVHSMHDDLIYAERALAAGARGYVVKQEQGEELQIAIREVLKGGNYVSSRVKAGGGKGKRRASRRGGHTSLATLSPREFEVFRFIGRGITSREIARELHISLKTVEAHRDHIRQKLKLESGTALNLFAIRWESVEGSKR